MRLPQIRLHSTSGQIQIKTVNSQLAIEQT